MIDEGKSCELVWENVFKHNKWGRYPSEDLIRFITKYFGSIENRKNVKILEMGCGTGSNLCYLASEGFCPYGVDISKTGVDRAFNTLNDKYSGWGGQVFVGDILQLPFENNFFDAVLDIEAVYCNSYSKACNIYKEAARVTKPGGYVYVRTFAEGTVGEKTGIKLGHNAWQPTEGPFIGKGYTRFTQYSEISDLMSEFKILEIELLTRTINNMQNEIKEWSITGKNDAL